MKALCKIVHGDQWSVTAKPPRRGQVHSPCAAVVGAATAEALEQRPRNRRLNDSNTLNQPLALSKPMAHIYLEQRAETGNG